MKTKIISVVLAIVFIGSGGAKLAGLEFEIQAFEKWGYALWFMYFIGTVEVLGGIGLLIRRTSALAAAGLSLMMVGAVATHVIHSEWGMMVVASVILALAVWRAIIGRNDIKLSL